MQGKRVDVVAWLRSIAPMWLVWALYAVPLAWLWSLWLLSENGGMIGAGQHTVYDENGNLLPSPPTDGPGPMIGLLLMLTVGFSQSVSSDSVVLALGLAAGLLVVHLHRSEDRPRMRLVSSVGAVLALGPPALAALVVIKKDEAVSSIDASGAFFSGLGEVTNLRFLLPGAVSLVIAWLLFRIGWGPLPVQAVVAQQPPASEGDSPGLPLAETGGAQGSVQPEPATPDPGSASSSPWEPDEVLVVVPAVRREEPAWDELPTLPADFRAPEPPVSPYARPSAGLRTGDSTGVDGSDGSDGELATDPYAAYRRPEVSMGERRDGGD